MLPRPELSDLLGINYRRIPVLVIGRDVYCDTGLISSVIERRFSQEDGHGTIFPKRKGGGLSDTGMIKAFVLSYTDSTLFPLGAASLPYEKMPEAFIKDRSLVNITLGSVHHSLIDMQTYSYVARSSTSRPWQTPYPRLKVILRPIWLVSSQFVLITLS